MAWNGGLGLRMNHSAAEAAAAATAANIEDDAQQPINSAESQQNGEQTLSVQHFCTLLQDKINVVFRLEPLEPPKNIYGRREVVPQVPMRLVVVLDVSHSMAEPYGSDSKLSKLERIKLFAKLLVKTIGHEDHLSIVTFGTTAEVVFPLKKMPADAKQQALRQIDTIDVRGVTNMSAGIFAAIDQFNVTFAKSRNFNDNILLFTDGMANEGITESEELIKEIRRKIKVIKEECHFGNDYVIKFSSLGTGGFMPELLFNIGQTFSSDGFFFLNEDASLELDLMLPILMKQNSAVDGLKVTISALNGVQFDCSHMSKEYMVSNGSDKEVGNPNTKKSFFIYDIAYASSRHIICCIKLPHKHKKVLKGKEVLKFEVCYRDAFLCSRSMEKVVSYAEIPQKEKRNDEACVLVTAKHECRRIACLALDKAATLVAKLDRTAAKDALQAAVRDLHNYFEYVSNDFFTTEESHIELSDFVDSIVANLEMCDRFIGDFAVRWDDAWGRIKALQSSLSREVPTSTGVFADGAEMYCALKVKERLHSLSDLLREMYIALGMSVSTLDKYQRVVEELETKLD